MVADPSWRDKGYEHRPAVGDGVEPYFRDEWPRVASAIARGLRRRGASPEHVEDVVQETALRLLERWDLLDPGRRCDAYVRTVATNIWHDAVRATSFKYEVPGTLPDQPSEDHVERSGLARVELARVARVLATLTPRHQAVIRRAAAASITGDETTAVPPVERMARMRARRRLADAASVPRLSAAIE